MTTRLLVAILAKQHGRLQAIDCHLQASTRTLVSLKFDWLIELGPEGEGNSYVTNIEDLTEVRHARKNRLSATSHPVATEQQSPL